MLATCQVQGEGLFESDLAVKGRNRPGWWYKVAAGWAQHMEGIDVWPPLSGKTLLALCTLPRVHPLYSCL